MTFPRQFALGKYRFSKDSQESDSPVASLKHLKFDRFQGGESKDKSQGCKKEGSFVVPKFSEDNLRAAYTRIQAAPAQVL